MSKASAWAAQYQGALEAKPADYKEPRDNTPGSYLDAEVDTHGRCEVCINGRPVAWLPPERALALARWILETFSEPASA